MKCTDCHSPHGTSNASALRQSGWETCTQCHSEKRGPFVFEHSAVKVQGCTACHTPHGSVNAMLLVRRETRFLCLQCHVNPFAANVPHTYLLALVEVSPDGPDGDKVRYLRRPYGADLRLPFDTTATTLSWNSYWQRSSEPS